MKYILILAVIGISISACTERPADQAALKALIVYVKPDVIKPAIIPGAPITTTTTCSFDVLNGGGREDQNTISEKPKVRLGGWATSSPGSTILGEVYLELEGQTKLYIKAIRASVKRPDVAAAHKNPILNDSSWEVNLDMSAMAPGKYKMRIFEVDGKSATICDPNGFLIIS